MTIIDVFILLPTWAKIVIGTISFVWLFEAFLLHFKINMYTSTLKRIETLLEQIIFRIEANKSIEADYKKMVSLMQMIFEKDKKEK